MLRLSLIPRSRVLAMSLVAAITGGLLVAMAIAAPTPADAASGSVSLSATSTKSVLAGSTTTVTLTATNASSTNEYNVAFRYVLPVGATYTAPTSPSSAGEPTITTTGGAQTLVWTNVSDLLAGDTSTLSFAVTPAASTFMVGSTVGGSGSVYASEDARYLPTFTADGTASTHADDTSTATNEGTKITALTVAKSEPSPEHELMRGVHDNRTVYKLVVTNTAVAATDGVTVTDYLPAQLEFLECGNVDHTTASAPEYTDSGALGAGTAPDTHGNCLPPQSVSTVTNPTGYPAGVYTKVVWDIGQMTSAAPTTIEYVAGIPQRANAAWPVTEPTGDTEAANLDNNTGASTRQIGAGQQLTNHAVAAGSYTGPVQNAGDRSVSAEDEVTVLATDLSIVKSVTTSPTAADGSAVFTKGGTATYSLRIRSSEYESDSAMTITDVLDNGLCPAYPADVTPTGDAIPSDCSVAANPSLAGQATNATIDAVSYSAATGKFTLTMTPTLGTGTSATIGRSYDTAAANTNVTYTARMRTTYSSASTSGPTASGDSFGNTVTIDGTSTPINDTDPASTTRAVTNGSGTSIATNQTTISKQVLSRTAGPVGSANDCAASQGTYSPTTDSANPFQLGDDVCFRLEVDFATGVDTRNAAVTDFLPVGTTFVDAALPAGSPFDGTSFVRTGDGSDKTMASWNVGTTQGSNGRYVDAGAKLVFYVMANITAQGSKSTAPDLVDNLMKYKQENTAGAVRSLRTSVGYQVASAPTAALSKEIVSRNGTAITPTTSTATTEGQALGYQLAVQNTGTSDAGTNREIDDVVVWDALPAGISCSDVTFDATNGAACGAAPSGAAASTPARSYLTWTIPSIAAGATTTLAYTMTIPAGVSVATTFRNDSSVTRFTSPNTSTSGGVQGATTYRTTDSLDRSAPAATDGTAVPANAAASAAMPASTVRKTGGTSDSRTNVSGLNGVAGENAAYTYTATVPARATVFNAVLADAPQKDLLASAGTTTITVTDPSGATAATTAWGTGTTFTYNGQTFTVTGDGQVQFPSTYDNQTDSDQSFAVSLAGLTIDPTTTATTVTNTASFAGTATAARDSSAVAALPSTVTVNVVAPVPTITKTVAVGQNVGAGSTVTYKLKVGNASTIANAYDVLVVDCLPAGVTFVPGSFTNSAGSAPSSTFEDGSAPSDAKCTGGRKAYGATYSVLEPGASSTLTFQATLDSDAAASAEFRNEATIVTSTLSDAKRDATTEALQSATDEADVVVAKPQIDKTVTTAHGTSSDGHTATAPAGDVATYTISVTVPANANLYDAFVRDDLPAGMVRGTGTATISSSDGSITGSELTPSTSGGVTTIGFALGSITPQSADRTVTITVPITVPAASTSGQVYANRAAIKWNESEQGQPTTPTATTQDSVQSTTAARVTATAPLLGIAKTASTTTPVPGSTFGYTLVVKNTGTSSAYATTVTDAVPAGVVVDPASISNGGTISGQAADGSGGGTITWTGLQVDTATPTTLRYSAVLASSDTLSGGALTNTASIPSYWSIQGGTGATYTGPSVSANVTPKFPAVTLAKAPTSSDIAYAGASFPWTVTITNAGSPVTHVHATDTLPTNWTYDAGSARLRVGSGQPVAVDAPTTTSAGGVQTLDWADLGSVGGAASPQLVSGATWTLTYTATPQTAATANPGAGHSIAHLNTFAAVVRDGSNATHTASGANKDSFVTNTNQRVSAVAHIDAADLAVTKKALTGASAPIAGAGAVPAWTISVANAGSDQSVGPFHVVDTPTLPTGVTLAGASGSGWTCTVSGASLTCDTAASATVASGSTLPLITVQVTIDQAVAAGTSVANTAAVTNQHTFDPTSSNDSDSATVTTAASADLAITKTGPATAKAGDTVTYTLAVTDRGPSNAAGPVTVDDAVPSGIRVTGVDGGADWTCDAPSSTVHCVLAAGLAANGTVSAITVTGVVKSSTTGTVTNTATVASPTTDPNTANNTSGAVSTAVDSATTLRVDKALTSFTPGTTGTYTIAVTNTGKADARHVVLHDPLPNGLTYRSADSADGWTCSADAAGTTVDCTLAAALVAGDSAGLTLTVNVPAGIRATVVNTATASADNAAAVDGSASTSTTPLTELSIDKSDDAPADLVAGQSFDYAIAVGNTGPSDIVTGDTTTVTDVLPAGETFVSASGTGWTVVRDGQTLRFTSTRGVLVGAQFPAIAIRVTVNAATPAGAVANTATVTSSAAAHSATDTDTVGVATRADVTIRKVLAPGSSTVAGTDATYTVTVGNSGPSDARSLSLTDLAPTGMTVTGIAQTSGPAWTCDTASCTISELAPGDAGTSVFTVTASIASSVRPATLTNTASVVWTDSRGGRSAVDTADLAVVDRAALTMQKSAVDADGQPVTTVAAGNRVSWLLQVHNGGPSDSDGSTTVTDHLPTGMTFVGLADTAIDGANSGWTCTVDPRDTQVVTCVTADGVVAGTDAAPLVITTTIDPAEAAGTTTNTAAVSSPTTSAVGTNGGAQGGVTVAPEANVAITITHSGNGTVGQPIPATATVVNTGPSVATGVTATITLPKGLTFLDTTGTDPSWTAGTPVVQADGSTTIGFTLTGVLAPGQTAPPIVVTSTVTAGAYPSATVGATTATATTETTLSDNRSETAITIAALSSLSVTKTHTQALVRNHTLGYTITVRNDGPTPDPGPVTVTDALPTGLTFVSIDGAGVATCTDGQTVVCTLDAPLAVDASVAVRLTVKVGADAPDSVLNRAVVATPTVQVASTVGTTPGVGSSTADPLRAADPGAVAPDPTKLAYTGSTSVLALLAFALMAITGGAAIVVLRRRGRREYGIRRR